MNSKQYEFLKKDIKFLRKNAFTSVFYSIIFISIFVLQFLLFIYENEHSKITTTQGAVGATVMVCLIFLSTFAILLAGRDFSTIMQIKKNFHSVRQVYVFSRTEKSGFLNMYSVVNRIIGIITLILSASVVTYAVLDYIYNQAVMFFLPTILTIMMTSFSSSNQLSIQLKISRTVNEYYDKI